MLLKKKKIRLVQPQVGSPCLYMATYKAKVEISEVSNHLDARGKF